MNARLYDPAVGRFLSPDPYVQAPDMTQNFNRYSYVLNNPLKYIDRTGEDYYSTDDPDEIQRLIDYLRSKGNEGDGEDRGAGAGASDWSGFDFGNEWNHVPDVDIISDYRGYSSGLTVNTTTGFGYYTTVNILGDRSWEITLDKVNTNDQAAWGYISLLNLRHSGITKNAGNTGLGATFYVGMGLTSISEIYFSKDLNTWMGKDFKIRNQSWGGNQYTGGKLKFAKDLAKPFKYGTGALGVYSMYNSISDGFEGKISPTEATGDAVFGSAAIYSGFWGGWANFWYNLGKEYGPMSRSVRQKEKGKNQYPY
jgi:RHS repeat-associated core domain